MSVRRIYVEKRQGFFDVPAQQLRDDIIDTFRLLNVKAVRIIQRYDIEGLEDAEYEAVKNTVLSEPPVDVIYEEELPPFQNSHIFAVEYLPGQYDQRADSAAQCIQLVTQKERPKVRAARVIVIVGDLDTVTFQKIKAYCINAVESREASLEKPESLEEIMQEPADVEIIKGFLQMRDGDLKAFMEERGLAMNFEDLRACQAYFRFEETRDPSITEIRVIDTYWSDHCRHTTFTTALDKVTFEEGYFKPLFTKAYDQYLEDRKVIYTDEARDMTLMDLAVIGMKRLKKEGKLQNLDVSEEINACSIEIPVTVGENTETWLLMFKNETHNHPTEIEPFGGAATCLGGAIRDPLSGRSYVYQAMRLTGCADPRKPFSETRMGKLPQKKITTGAAAGYSSYGNQIGLATGQVHEIYHEGYLAKRLEIGAVIAAAPKENVVRERPTAGDVIVLVGGRTGRDGCGGATGSSKEHTQESLTSCGAEVQKGNPPTERKIQRLFRNPDVSRRIKRCNDFGAGGVAVAIGELADGLTIDLDAIKKKYEGLDGTELAISESQERMAVVIASADVEYFCKVAEDENLETSIVARVTEEPILIMKWRGKEIVHLNRKFLDTNGVRQHVRVKVTMPEQENRYLRECPECVKTSGRNLSEGWLKNLRNLNVCSQKGLSERFDSTIGGSTVLMPFGGKYQLTPMEGMVAKIPVVDRETETASAMTFGMDPFLAEWSPFHGALYAVVQAAAKMVALGASPEGVRLTFQEYFERMGTNPEVWGKPFAALLGALVAQHELEMPAIGGKDSMSGTFEDIHVPPTFAAFAVNTLPAGQAVSAEFKYAGNMVYAIPCIKDSYDMPRFGKLMNNFKRIHELIKERRVFSAMSVGIGGIAATVAKMTMGNQVGFRFKKEMSKEELFCPDYGTILIEVSNNLDVTEILDGTSYYELGKTTDVPSIVCGSVVVTLAEVQEAYTEPLEKLFPTTAKLSVKEKAVSTPFVSGKYNHSRHSCVKPKIFIPVFPGTNCEYDSEREWIRAGGDPQSLVIRNLTPQAVEESVAAIAKGIRESQILMFPGGFSGGDEPDGSGKFIAAMFRHPRLKDEIELLLKKRDGLILGICNGFQALIKLGLLPYGEIRDLTPNAPTLTFNSIGRHVSCMVQTKIVSNLSPWFKNVTVGEIYTMPISHGEGRFVADQEIIAQMRVRGQIATQYVTFDGTPTMAMPYNPNGSVNAIEGITSVDGRILGKMGHSERVGKDICKNVPGKKDQMLFEAGVAYFA